MKYRYTLTSKIKELTDRLDKQSYLIGELPSIPRVIENLRRESTLKSSLFSARIEGNSLTYQEIRQGIKVNGKDVQKLEVQNLATAYDYVFSDRVPKELTLELIRDLHKRVMRNITPDAGKLRMEQTAIFNQVGVAVYVTPPPEEMKKQLGNLISETNQIIEKTETNRTSENYLISAVVAHYWFEKIHPFVDGNGRVGRLLTQYLIDRSGQRFKGLLTFEEQLEKYRSEYYSLLQAETNNLTDFIEFFLEMLSSAAGKTIEDLKQKPDEIKPEDELLPRRKEIFLLLKDHEYLSFDQIRRRFMAVNVNTLRYDLRQLLRQKLIKKIGSTRGVTYKVSINNQEAYG